MKREENVVVGIDMGGTNTELGVINQKGTSLAHHLMPTSAFDTYTDFATATAAAVASLANSPSLKAVGIGAPNGNYFSGTIDYAPNLPWKGVLPVADLLSEQLGIPVVLTNDANAAAIGEQYFGNAKDLKHFMVVTIGTGLGSGIIVNGRILYGSTGFAGELGHTTVVPNGRLCTCGRRGCLEEYVSARGLVNNTLELLEKSPGDSPLHQKGNFRPTDVWKAAKSGDALAIEAFAMTGRYLGQQLADMAALFSSEAFFLFGGLANAGDLLLGPTQQSFADHLMPVLHGSSRVELSALSHNNAGILGAAALAWNEIQ